MGLLEVDSARRLSLNGGGPSASRSQNVRKRLKPTFLRLGRALTAAHGTARAQHVDCCTHAHLQSAGISEFDSAKVMAAHRRCTQHVGRHPRGDRRSWHWCCCRLGQRQPRHRQVRTASACMPQPPWCHPISPSTFTHQLARSQETTAVPHSRSLSLCARLVWQVLLELEQLDQY